MISKKNSPIVNYKK